jgi:hypothetical protein
MPSCTGLDVATFQDSNGDGIGDFPGLISRLDYLADLGVTCLWLLPFFPSPNRDNGYDVTDYFGVDPRLGTFDEFRLFVHQAGERGLRVLIDLVMDHTSDLHPCSGPLGKTRRPGIDAITRGRIVRRRLNREKATFSPTRNPRYGPSTRSPVNIITIVLSF